MIDRDSIMFHESPSAWPVRPTVSLESEGISQFEPLTEIRATFHKECTAVVDPSLHPQQDVVAYLKENLVRSLESVIYGEYEDRLRDLERIIYNHGLLAIPDVSVEFREYLLKWKIR